MELKNSMNSPSPRNTPHFSAVTKNGKPWNPNGRPP
jgi:hypothetical protein